MRPYALLAVSGLALALGACASNAPVAAVTATAASAPAPMDGYDWFYHEDGGAARLAYGVEASDDLKLGLDCERGARRVALSTVAPKDAAHEIHLESGGDTERYAAQAEPSEIEEGDIFLSAEADVNEPVFVRFRQTGWLAVWTGDERHAYAPHPASRDGIEKFFVFCG